MNAHVNIVHILSFPVVDIVPTRTNTPLTRTIKPLDNTKAKIVIILAYMHTGSTYTGGLIEHHPGTYYEYESLRSLQMATKRKRMIRYLHDTPR